MFDRRISIFTGHFGSGKTEVAVNYAMQLSRNGNKTAIVDFDIVNPYFRTADAKTHLENNGIWVITPVYANTNVDVPALPSEISSLFIKKEYMVVFDVGGDDLGAKAVSRYREEFVQNDYELFFVVNTRRPMTDSQEKIEEMIYDIEESARMKITSIVNNTNLLEKTTFGEIIAGHRLIERVSSKLGIPIGFVSGFGDALAQVKAKLGVEALSLEKLIKLPWD